MKRQLLNASLVASAMFLTPWCQSEPMGGVTLAVLRDRTNAIVSWPYQSTGFGLEFSTILSTTNWQPAAGTAVSNNGRWAVTRPVSLPPSFLRLKNPLQHFGFWAGSVAGAGSIVEQRGFVNFTMGAGPGPSADQAIALGMKPMFFAPAFADPQIQAQLDAIRPYAAKMLAFFTMDEPDCVAGGSTAKLDQLLSSIESQISQLKLSFPGVPTMMTVGCAFWSYSNFRIPRGLDYIAIESYGSSGDPATTRAERISKLRLLKPYMNSSQRLFMIPGANDSHGTESQLIQKANDIYTYAQTDPLVVGVFPFDWYSDTYDCAGAGVFCGNGVPATNYSIKVIGNASARDLANLRARYIEIGQSIMNGAFLDVGAGGPWIQFL